MLGGHVLAPIAEFLASDLTGWMLVQLIGLLSRPLFWAGLGAVLGPYLFLRGFRLLARKRLILNMPRSTVRAAALGPIEVSGKAVGPYTLLAPLSGRECLYYRVVIRARRQAASAYSHYGWNADVAGLWFLSRLLRQQSRKNAHRIIDEACAPLFLDDGTGELLIYPKGAELFLPRFQSQTGGCVESLLHRHGFAREDFEAAEEISILPGDEIFAMGTLAENRWARSELAPGQSELSPVGPGFVSADAADLLRREAFLYLDPNAPSGVGADRPFNLHPPIILIGGPCPFVISSSSQREIVTRLSWQSLVFVWGAPLWFLWSIWEILGHPELWAAFAGTR